LADCIYARTFTENVKLLANRDIKANTQHA